MRYIYAVDKKLLASQERFVSEKLCKGIRLKKLNGDIQITNGGGGGDLVNTKKTN